MTPHMSASIAVLDEQYDAMVAFLRELSDDCLNWQPPIADTNTIAAMTVHIAGALDSWLARALGETIERDRDAEFGARSTAETLIARIERSRADCHRRLAAIAELDLAGEIPVRRLSGPYRGQPVGVSRAWCVEHALIHAGEHWGQIQLTRQFYDARV